MSAAGLVVLVIGIFFLIGIWVGVVAVMALAARRRDRKEQRDDHPRWPDNGFRN